VRREKRRGQGRVGLGGETKGREKGKKEDKNGEL
jgi:hypothetical protein